MSAIEHNEWLYKKASWSEILVVNCKSGEELWISRRYMGEVSRVDDPVLIVGLNRELEYKSGMVVPFQRRVIEMPVAVGGKPAVASPSERPAPGLIVGIRMASAQDKRIFKLIGAAVTVAILMYVLAVNLSRQRVVFTARDQTYLGLTARDDRTEVVVETGRAGERPLAERARGAAIRGAGLSGPQAHGDPDGQRPQQCSVCRHHGQGLEADSLGAFAFGRDDGQSVARVEALLRGTPIEYFPKTIA